VHGAACGERLPCDTAACAPAQPSPTNLAGRERPCPRVGWVTLRALCVTRKSSLGDAKSSLGDAESSLGDAKSSLRDAKCSLGDAKELAG
jgi:hypothetical protein